MLVGLLSDVGVADLHDSVDNVVSGLLLSDGGVTRNPADGLRGSESWGGQQLEPFLLGEGVSIGLLDLGALLLDAFVLALCHALNILVLICKISEAEQITN